MKKKKINKLRFKLGKKGGLWGEIPGVFKLILVLVVIFLFSGYLLKTFTSVKNKGVDLIKNEDFDHDGIKNVFDKCPCGEDNTMRTDGLKSYCVANLNEVACKSTQNKKYYEWKTVGNGISNCYYTLESCTQQIQDDYASGPKK